MDVSFSQTSVATLGFLPVRVKAWCSFEVVSGMGDKFDLTSVTAQKIC